MGVEMKLAITAEDTASPVIDRVNGKIDTLGAGATGGKLPQVLNDMNVAGTKADGVLGQLGGALGGTAGKLALVGAAAAAATVAIGALKDGLVTCVNAAADAEDADHKLYTSLKITGDYTPKAAAGIEEWSEKLLQATGVSDELAKSLLADGNAMELTIERSEQFVEIAADMKTKLGSVEAGFDLLSRAATGDQRAIMTLGKEFGLAGEKIKDFDVLLARIQEKVSGQAVADLNTFRGQWRLLREQFGEIAEAAGGKLLPALTSAGRWLNELVAKIRGADSPQLVAELKEIEARTTALDTAAKKAAPAVEALDAVYARAIKNAKTVARSWSDDLKQLEKDHAAALDAMKAKQDEFDTWIKLAKENLAARAAGGVGIGAAGMSDAEKQLAAEEAAQQLLLDAANETGQKRLDLLNKYAEYFEQAKTAEIAADRRAMDEMASANADQYAQDWTNLQAALDAKVTEYRAAHEQIVEMIAEETASLASTKQGDVDALKTRAAEIERSMDGLRTSISEVNADLDAMEAKLKDAKTVKLDATQAQADMSSLSAKIAEVDAGAQAARELNVATENALTGVEKVRAAIAAIPDVSYKTVVMEFKTKASPVRPFGEGMDEIYDRLAKLPNEAALTIKMGESVTDLERDLRNQLKESGTYRNDVGIRWGGTLTNQEQLLAQRNQSGTAKGGSATGAASNNSTTNATFNITATSQSAKDLDKELAALYSSKRSKLRQAMEAA